MDKQKTEKEYITFYNTSDVAKMLGCSLPVARAIMYRADFPLIRVGKALKVSKHAFEEWTSKRQENEQPGIKIYKKPYIGSGSARG